MIFIVFFALFSESPGTVSEEFHLGSSHVSVGKTCELHAQTSLEWMVTPSIFWGWGRNEDLDINWRELEIYSLSRSYWASNQYVNIYIYI